MPTFDVRRASLAVLAVAALTASILKDRTANKFCLSASAARSLFARARGCGDATQKCTHIKHAIIIVTLPAGLRDLRLQASEASAQKQPDRSRDVCIYKRTGAGHATGARVSFADLRTHAWH